tara:strand:+ start:1118 stop:1324 length:207 start_codon:yes stop_codon:yes gene_type:complete
LSIYKDGFVEPQSTYRINDRVWRKGTTFKCTIWRVLPGDRYKLYDEEKREVETKTFRADQLRMREYYE